jgi:hypothetical protein
LLLLSRFEISPGILCKLCAYDEALNRALLNPLERGDRIQW